MNSVIKKVAIYAGYVLCATAGGAYMNHRHNVQFDVSDATISASNAAARDTQNIIMQIRSAGSNGAVLAVPPNLGNVIYRCTDYRHPARGPSALLLNGGDAVGFGYDAVVDKKSLVDCLAEQAGVWGRSAEEIKSGDSLLGRVADIATGAFLGCIGFGQLQFIATRRPKGQKPEVIKKSTPV